MDAVGHLWGEIQGMLLPLRASKLFNPPPNLASAVLPYLQCIECAHAPNFESGPAHCHYPHTAGDQLLYQRGRRQQNITTQGNGWTREG